MAFDPQKFGAAWNAHDLELIMAMSTDDCEFWASAGREAQGARHVGPQAVRKAYKALFETFPDGQWTNSRATWLNENRVLSEWLFVATKADGTRLEVDGLDLLELENNKVKIKNSFRKTILS